MSDLYIFILLSYTGEENPAAGGASQPEDEPDDLADLSDEDAENDGGADVMKGRSRRTQVRYSLFHSVFFFAIPFLT